jgi:hypothetical protein
MGGSRAGLWDMAYCNLWDRFLMSKRRGASRLVDAGQHANINISCNYAQSELEHTPLLGICLFWGILS